VIVYKACCPLVSMQANATYTAHNPSVLAADAATSLAARDPLVVKLHRPPYISWQLSHWLISYQCVLRLSSFQETERDISSEVDVLHPVTAMNCTVKSPSSNYRDIQDVCKQRPPPLLPANRWSVAGQQPVHQIHPTHAFVISSHHERLSHWN